MKCPHCSKEIEIPNRAYMNLESYNPTGSTLVVAECCNKPVVLSSRILYSVGIYTGTDTEDNWGVEIEQ